MSQPQPQLQPVDAALANELITERDRQAEVLSAAAATLAIGQFVAGRYELLELLGRGGFGAVYRAEDHNIGRMVAIKVLHAAHEVDAVAVKRFRQEVDCIAQIRHPNVIAVTDFGVDPDAGHFLVLPLLQGRSLHAVMDERQLDWSEIQLVVTQVLEALAAAHELGVVHQDLKPENIMLVQNRRRAGLGDVQLLDFGIASIGGTQLETAKQTVIGTPGWMSPEQLTQAPTDGRSDLYSLGVLLYWLATGDAPFHSPDIVDLMRQHAFALPRPPAAAPGGGWIPAELDAFILDLLAKDPAWRPASAEAAMERWLTVQPAASEAWALHLIGGSDAHARQLMAEVTVPTNRPVYTREELERPPPPPMLEEPPVSDGVLIVDDDAAMQFLVRSVVQAVGWPCWTVDSVDAAVRWLDERGHPRVVVTDLLMPGGNAFDMLAALDRLNFRGGRVVCTTVASQAVREQAERTGAAYVNKAMELYKLPEVLEPFRVPAGEA